MTTSLVSRFGVARRAALSLCLLAATCVAHAGPAASAKDQLVGEWVAQKSTTRALEGIISIRADGTATLAPFGYPKLSGTWELKNDALALTMQPHGTTLVRYHREGNRLQVTYEGGGKQDFVLATPGKP